MSLTFITDEQAQAATSTISAILYGPEKSGKSTGAASAPGPILYLNGDAPSRLRYARRSNPDKDIREVRIRPRPPEGQATAIATLNDVVLYASDPANGIKTVVADPIGRIYACVLDEYGGRKPQIQHHGEAQAHMERFVLALLELPVHVVLVAHDHPYTMGTNEEGSEIKELLPFCGSSSNPALAKNLMRPVDVIAYCGFRDKDDDGNELPKREHVAQLFSAGGRRAGDGLGVLGDVRALDLTEWVALNEAAATNGNGKTKSKEK